MGTVPTKNYKLVTLTVIGSMLKTEKNFHPAHEASNDKENHSCCK